MSIVSIVSHSLCLKTTKLFTSMLLETFSPSQARFYLVVSDKTRIVLTIREFSNNRWIQCIRCAVCEDAELRDKEIRKNSK